jgi:hypothetical protein
MDQAALVRIEFERIEKGAELVLKLREGGLGVESAYWLFTSESGRRMLHMIIPDLEHRGIRKTYRVILDTIGTLPEDFFSIDSHEVTVEDRTAPLAKAIDSLRERHGEEFSKTGYGVRIDDQYLEGVYIYRKDMRL